MKKIKILALLLSIIMACALIFVSCDNENSDNTTIGNGIGNGGDTPTPKPTPVLATSVSLSETAVILTKDNRSKTLTATVYPANATNKTVTWSSSDEKVVKVDNFGECTFWCEGEATVTARTSNGKTAECRVVCSVPYTDKVLSFATYIHGSPDFVGGSKKISKDDSLPFVIYAEEKNVNLTSWKWDYRIQIFNKNSDFTDPLCIQSVFLNPTVGQSNIRIIDDLLLANASNAVEIYTSVPVDDTHTTLKTFRLANLQYEITDDILYIVECKYDKQEWINAGYSQAQLQDVIFESWYLIEDALNQLRYEFLERWQIDIFARSYADIPNS